MSTRHADDNSPLNQERYMSSPEYAELRGVMGNAATAKASILNSPRKRSLLFFLQALSLEPGGMRAVAEKIFEMFPERIGTAAMFAAKVRPGAKLSDGQVEMLLQDSFSHAEFMRSADLLTSHDCWGESEHERLRREDKEKKEVEAYKARLVREASHDADHYLAQCRRTDPMIAFLIDLCVNPRLLLPEPDGSKQTDRDQEIAAFVAQHEELDRYHFKTADVPFFQDICGALFEFQKRYTAAAAQSFAPTTVARRVHETLDACLKSRRMVLIEGESDSGKSTSAEAWCRMHKGEARFVRLQGVTNKTVFFRAIARALGVASTYTRTAKEMQARVEDVLQRSGLCLVLDESQYAFAQSERIYSRPELVDWIYTACCNHGVPVALVATPLFSKRLHQAEKQTVWNSDQFRRRIYRFEILPPVPTANDIDLVVKHYLPDAGQDARKYLAGYAKTCVVTKIDPATKAARKVSFALTAIADTLADANLLAEAAGRTSVTLSDLTEAVKTFRTTSELAKCEAFDTATIRKRAGRPPAAQTLQPACSGVAEAAEMPVGEDTFTERSRSVAALKTTATREIAPAFSEA